LKADITVVVDGLATQLGQPAPGGTAPKTSGTTVSTDAWNKARDNINHFRAVNCPAK
jgi:hypothetical protein